MASILIFCCCHFDSHESMYLKGIKAAGWSTVMTGILIITIESYIKATALSISKKKKKK